MRANWVAMSISSQFAIGEAGAVNAALFAVAMLALNDHGLAKKLTEFLTSQTEKVLSKTLTDLP